MYDSVYYHTCAMGLEVPVGRLNVCGAKGAEDKMATMKQDGASNYLLKTEPSEYSFADLQKDKETVWDGVSNPVALRNLREMKPGTRLVIYETGDQKTAVGTASVVSVDASNPKNPEVEIKAGKDLAKPMSLAQNKSDPLFATSPLVRD